jgi:hypothetical protein
MRLLSRSSGGVEAGALGTLAMDALLNRRHHHTRRGVRVSRLAVIRRRGTPAVRAGASLVAKPLAETATRREVPPPFSRLLDNVVNLGFGVAKPRLIDASHFVWEQAPAEYSSTVLDSIVPARYVR